MPQKKNLLNQNDYLYDFTVLFDCDISEVELIFGGNFMRSGLLGFILGSHPNNRVSNNHLW